MPIIAGRASAAVGAGFSRVVTPGYAGPFGAYDSLATVTVGATAVSSISFAGIPTGYKHLQIRWIGLNTDTTSSGIGNIRTSLFFNGDTTATNYYIHHIGGDGATADAYVENAAKFAGNSTRNSMIAPGVNIIDIHDYASTTKNKTVRCSSGITNNDTDGTANLIRFMSGSWTNTSAINTMQLVPEAGTFKQHTHIALYGVK